MPTQVTEFKCPACTAPLHFSEETGRLECDYCGSSFTVAEAEAFSAERSSRLRKPLKRPPQKPGPTPGAGNALTVRTAGVRRPIT